MDAFWKIYCDYLLISIPLTLFVIGIVFAILDFIINIIKEILDFIINRDNIEKQQVIADNISFIEIERGIIIYTEKLNLLDEWTLKKLELVQKKRDLEKVTYRGFKKIESEANSQAKIDLYEASKYLDEKYWTSKWRFQREHKEIEQEIKIRKLFNPDSNVFCK